MEKKRGAKTRDALAQERRERQRIIQKLVPRGNSKRNGKGEKWLCGGRKASKVGKCPTRIDHDPPERPSHGFRGQTDNSIAKKWRRNQKNPEKRELQDTY